MSRGRLKGAGLKGAPFNQEFTVRAPGRVNLIGEHIDYCLLPVLPMAIQRHVTLTVLPRSDGQVRLSNRTTSFRDVEFQLSTDIDPGPAGDWGNYAKGVAQELVRGHGISRGADILVDSDLPVAAGLSSSSAFSIAVALALLAANDQDLDRLELAALVAEAERYTGTRGGGMDQAIICCGHSGHALDVRFAPLQVRSVPVPDDWVFLVAHSGVVAEKSGNAQTTYNDRTHECAQALAAMWPIVIPGEQQPSSGIDYRPLFTAVDHPRKLLELAEDVLETPVMERFRHVVGEAVRVNEANKALIEGDLTGFGQLMNASHQSLCDDYEVSTTELDQIVSIARDAGAAGARLTGAGLGGAVLVLCGESNQEAIREALASRYYEPRGQVVSEDLLFRVIASEGAGLKGV